MNESWKQFFLVFPREDALCVQLRNIRFYEFQYYLYMKYLLKYPHDEHFNHIFWLTFFGESLNFEVLNDYGRKFYF